jgi:hypothetical protein
MEIFLLINAMINFPHKGVLRKKCQYFGQIFVKNIFSKNQNIGPSLLLLAPVPFILEIW